MHLSGSLHPEDLRGREMLTARAADWLREAGAATVRPMSPIGPGSPPSAGQHQAGTCRMGTDPRSSVVDPGGRVWGHEHAPGLGDHAGLPRTADEPVPARQGEPVEALPGHDRR
ncbi:GMC oxidoreductase [Brachybacterium sp.]|uniref:GMC oxidoreductase n=1 Tax=Brachybacterium sp. TaxID=1891286 RepID=UPI0039C8B942